MFSREKFLSLPKTQQHKKCCEFLSEYLKNSLEKSSNFHDYLTLSKWMGYHPLECIEKLVAKRLDEHLASVSHPGNAPFLAEALGDKEETAPVAPLLPIAIYLEGLRSAHNVGSIIRTAEAFRLGIVHLGDQVPGKEHPGVKKAAMGAENWLPIIEGAHVDNLPKPLIAIEIGPQAKDLNAFCFPDGPFSLALGSESAGLSASVLEQADAIVQIPLFGRKASLNVANAFAIVASAIRDQKA